MCPWWCVDSDASTGSRRSSLAGRRQRSTSDLVTAQLSLRTSTAASHCANTSASQAQICVKHCPKKCTPVLSEKCQVSPVYCLGQLLNIVKQKRLDRGNQQVALRNVTRRISQCIRWRLKAGKLFPFPDSSGIVRINHTSDGIHPEELGAGPGDGAKSNT